VGETCLGAALERGRSSSFQMTKCFRCSPWMAALAVAFAATAAATTAAVRPNILLIMSDDQGYADVGVNGCKDFATPHLDSIARNGVRCANGYVTAPQCAPSRCGLLTGRYQPRFGYEFNNDSPGVGLPLDQITIAQRLQAAGYVTGAVGKWHLGREEPFHPLNRGFTEFFGFLGGGHAYLAPSKPAAGGRADLWRGRAPAEHTKYLTDQFGDEAASFVERHADAPWFLYLAFNAPHVPLQAAPEYLARVPDIADPTRRTYAAMMTALDDNVGRVLAKLRATRQEERTLVIFLSDNGGPLGNAWNGSSNAPFSGQKGDTQEGGIHVPFFAQWKSVLPAGKVFAAPVISVDLAPTFLAAAGVNVPADAGFDGVNLLPAWKGEATLAVRTLYWRFNFPPARPDFYKAAVRQGDWKLVKSWERAAESSGFKPSVWKLFNVTADPAEANDRMALEPARATAMQESWEAWNRELKEPFNGEPRAKESDAQAKRARKRKTADTK
jgi:arylsulfatase A-like enzyme